MIEGLVDWVERVDQLTYDMQDMVYNIDQFQTTASFWGAFIAFAITIIFILTIRNFASLRRIEQKLDSLISDVADLTDETEE